MACLFPFQVENPSYYYDGPNKFHKKWVPVPCGKCPPCLSRRSNGWAFRLLQQEKVSETASFVTLTYAPEHMNLSEKGFMTLVKKDFQDFMKRLRKLHPKDLKLKYYACGEYGSKGMRPHFHAIIYDLNRELLQKAWTKGDVHIGDVSGASVAYTVKYMHKGKMIPVHKNDDRQPEFSLMSKRLGANYLTQSVQDYHTADINRAYLTLEGGVKIAMPRYYKEKLYTDEQRKQQGQTVEKLSEEHERKLRRDYRKRTGSHSGYDRAKEEAAKAQINAFRKQTLTNRKKL